MWWRFRSAVLCGAACWWLGLGQAAAEPLRVDRSADRLRVDGALREWKGARFVELGEGDDAALRFAMASDDEGFYLAAEVRDDVLVRGPSPGPGQDALVLSLAMPDASGAQRVTEIWLHPGRVGREKAAAGLRADKVITPDPRLLVVEGPRERGAGYVIEAFIPFALVQGGELWEQGRAKLRFEDVDGALASKRAVPRASEEKTAESTLTTSSAQHAADWPRLALGTGHQDFLGSFLSERGLSGVEPRFDLRADVAGDTLPERVLIVDKFVLVYGRHFKQGQNYAYFTLPFSVGGGLISAELSDLTGDGRAELLTRVRQRNSLGARELLMVLALAEDSIASQFSLEVKKESKGGFLESVVSVEKGAVAKIRVSRGRAHGLDALTYQESPATDAVPILLPWGPVESRSYAFDGSRFALLEERSTPAREASAGEPVAAAVGASAPKQNPALNAVPSPFAPPDAKALAKMLQLEQSGPEAELKLAVKREGNLIGGPALETVFGFRRHLVVVGSEIGPLPAFIAHRLPIEESADLLALSLADVTGDGLVELLVRTAQRTPDGVAHELLSVFRLEPTEPTASQRRLTRLLVAEVGRRRDRDSIVNVTDVGGGKLRLSPGSARGFTRANYPFANEASPGIERLLLPWLDKPRSYRFDGARLLAE